MQERKNYLLKVDKKTNKIIDFKQIDGDLMTLTTLADKKNQSCDSNVRYLPMPKSAQEPTIGADATNELRDKIPQPNDEKMENTHNNVKSAIKVLMAVEMTIKGTHMCPIPMMDAEEAIEAIDKSTALLIALDMMHNHYKSEKEEQKQSVDDLFDQMGLKSF